MLRGVIVLAALAAGMSIAVATTPATPALAKGPSQARITGPGLARPIVVSGHGEPGQPGILGALALQTRLFSVMFGPNAPEPPPLRTPSAASLGPRYTIVYTVYGEFTRPGQQFGHIRQDLYPRAGGGPVIYTPQGQPGGPLPFFGWFRAGRHLPRTLAKLGISLPAATQAGLQVPAAHPAAPQQAGPGALPWLIGSAVAVAAAALAGTVLLLRRRKPATAER